MHSESPSVKAPSAVKAPRGTEPLRWCATQWDQGRTWGQGRVKADERQGPAWTSSSDYKFVDNVDAWARSTTSSKNVLAHSNSIRITSKYQIGGFDPPLLFDYIFIISLTSEHFWLHMGLPF